MWRSSQRQPSTARRRRPTTPRATTCSPECYRSRNRTTTRRSWQLRNHALELGFLPDDQPDDEGRGRGAHSQGGRKAEAPGGAAESPTWSKPRFFLGDCYRTLAIFDDTGGRVAGALRVWVNCVALAEGEPKDEMRTCQALDLARSGEHRKAWNLVRSLEPSLRALTQHYHYGHFLVAAVSSCRGLPQRRINRCRPRSERQFASSTETKVPNFFGAFWTSLPLRIGPPTARSCSRTRTWRSCFAARMFRPCSRNRRRLLTSQAPPIQSLATVSEQVEVNQLFNQNVAVLRHDRVGDFIE